MECWGYGEKAASSESAPTVDNSSQTPEVAEQTEDTQPETRAVSRTGFCIGSVSVYMSIAEDHLYRMVNYANAGLDDQLNVALLGQQAGIAVSVSNEISSSISADAPEDAKNLVRSIDKFDEKLTEYHANFEELNEQKITRGLQDLIDDFLDAQGKAEYYCGS